MITAIVKLKHDKGTIKIQVRAESLEDAENKVCQSENAPKSAVIYSVQIGKSNKSLNFDKS
jgi:hypothetical protein